MTKWVVRLVIANCIVFFMTMNSPALAGVLQFIPVQALSKPWTMISYMFVHANLTHILFNMLGLFFFGPRLELELGERNFLLLYFMSGIMGALISLFTTPLVAIVGASGAVYGVMFGFAYLWPRERIYVWGIIPVEARWMVVGMTVLSLYGGLGANSDGIAHFAHLGGFLGGLLAMRIFARRPVGSVEIKPVVEVGPSPAEMERWTKIRKESMHPVNREELDRLMAKLSGKGAMSLTPNERDFLDRFSER